MLLNGLYFRSIPVYRLQPVYIVVMGCKWVYLSVYGLYLQYLTRFVRCGLHIGLRFAIYQYLRVVGCYLGYMGGYMHPHPTPKPRTRNLGCLSKNFFIFSIRLLLAFFRANSLKSSIFLMFWLWLVGETRNLAIFRWFLGAFASWMRVYMFCIEKVSKKGLF